MSTRKSDGLTDGLIGLLPGLTDGLTEGEAQNMVHLVHGSIPSVGRREPRVRGST
jgi:hypothetical protein